MEGELAEEIIGIGGYGLLFGRGGMTRGFWVSYFVFKGKWCGIEGERRKKILSRFGDILFVPCGVWISKVFPRKCQQV